MHIDVLASARYDRIGLGYGLTRREDPDIALAVREALGAARTVVNVGAGTGSYEPRDRQVFPVEPSEVMIAQRDPALAPAIRGGACPLPFADASVDAALAVLTVHHWDDDRERGVRELRRVARGPVVILTFDPEVFTRMWLVADYLPEVAALDRRTFPSIATLADWLGGEVEVRDVLLSRETPDWMLASFWAHPERVSDATARAATSGFARMPEEVVERVVAAVERDLADGSWDARHGHLRELDEYDVGLRLVVSG